MKDRMQGINAVNAILAIAEDEITKVLGVKMRVIAVRDRPIMERGEEDLLNVIANTMQMGYADYQVPCRKDRYVRLRMLGIHFLKVYFPKMSLQKIGEHMGNIHHTSVIYLMKKTEGMLEVKDEFIMKYYEDALNAVTQWERD